MGKKCRSTFYLFTDMLSSLWLAKGNNNHHTEIQRKSSVYIVPIWLFIISVCLLPQIIWNCLSSLEKKNIIKNHMKTFFFFFLRAWGLQISDASRLFSRSRSSTGMKLQLNYFSEISTNLQHFHFVLIFCCCSYWPQKLMPPGHGTVISSVIIWREMFVPYF